MAKWPFSKKNTSDTDADTSAPSAPEVASGPTDTQPAEPVQAPAEGIDDARRVGPFDGDTVDISEFDFSDFSTGILDLGSLRIPLPKGSQVQVEMGQSGPKMLHIVTAYGRMTPVAFAAPRSSGQWEQTTPEIVEGMQRDGLDAEVQDGFFGPEVVGTNEHGVVRIIGIEGPRWLLRMTTAAPADKAEDMALLARETAARTFVYRGPDPVLAGNSLPVVLPSILAEQVQQAMAERATTTGESVSGDTPNEAS